MLVIAKHSVFSETSVKLYTNVKSKVKYIKYDYYLQVVDSFPWGGKCASLAAGLKEVRNEGSSFVLDRVVKIRGDLWHDIWRNILNTVPQISRGTLSH